VNRVATRGGASRALIRSSAFGAPGSRFAVIVVVVVVVPLGSSALICRPVPSATRRGSRPVVVRRRRGEREKEREREGERQGAASDVAVVAVAVAATVVVCWCLLVRFTARVFACLPARSRAVTPGGFDVPRSLRCPMVDRAPQYATRGRSTRRGSHCYGYAREYDCGTVKLSRGSAGGRERVLPVSSSSSSVIELITAATASVAPAPIRTAAVVF